MKYLLLFIYCIGYVLVSNGQYSFVNITDKEGLVNSNVTCILKDHYGFMWIGTYNGLSRYDGYTFKNFQKDVHSPYGLPENYIRCLYETQENDIYIGFHNNGFARYNRNTETFSYFTHSDKKQNSLLHNRVLTFFQDSKGNIWIGTMKGLDRFNPITKTFTHFYPFESKDNPAVTSIVEDEKGNLWIGGIGCELTVLKPLEQQQVYPSYSFIGNESPLYSFNVGVNLFYDKGYIYVGSERGVFVFSINENSSKYVDLSLPIGTLVRDIYRDSKRRLHIATDGQGVFIIQPDGRIDHLLHQANHHYSLASNAVYTICESSPGIIWYGTYAGGISQLNEVKHKFHSITEESPLGKRLLQNSVLSIVSDGHDKIYIGTDGGGLHVLNPLTGDVDVCNNSALNQVGGVIKCMALSNNNKDLWIGTFHKGSFVYDLKTQKVVSISSNQNSSKSNTILADDIWSLYTDGDGNSWMGMLRKGAHYYHWESKMFQDVPMDSVYISDFYRSSIFSMMKDSKNRLWFITESNGAFIYDLHKKQLSRLLQSANGKGLPSNNLRDVWEDGNGNIWLGTSNAGLIKVIDMEEEVFELYGLEHGLNTLQIVGILHDNKNNIWMATDKGLSVLDISTQKIRNFDEEDGLPCKAFNYNSKLRAPDGTLYFGGVGGLTFFQPSQIVVNKVKPNVLITDFKLFNQSISPKNKFQDRVILQHAIYKTDEIELEYSDNVIQLEFAALDYTSPKKSLYAYQLEGFDKDWVYVDAEHRRATYTNLDPGEYKFKVKASNNDGVWNEEGDTITLIILPPWWKTWWFRLGITIVIIFLIYAFYKYRVQSLVRKNDELQLKLTLCHQELSKQQRIKDKFYTIITQDLKNPITALFGMTHMLSNDLKQDYVVKEGDVEILTYLASTTKRMKDLLLDLLDWTKTQQSEIVQHKILVDGFSIVDETIDYLRTEIIRKKLTVVNNVWKSVMVEVDRQMLSKVLRKVISNAVKYSSVNDVIYISSTVIGDEFIISIKDTGIGMTSDDVERILQGEYHFASSSNDNKNRGSGMGLMVTNEFIQLMGGRMEIDSYVGEGTTFKICLPIHSTRSSSMNHENNKEDIVVNYSILGKQILILDENISRRLNLSKMLQPYFNVKSIENTNDLEVMIRIYSPDLILYDALTTGLKEIEICKELLNSTISSHIPLIMMSDSHKSDIADDFKVNIIPKDSSFPMVLEAINKVLTEINEMHKEIQSNLLFNSSRRQLNKLDEQFVQTILSYLSKNRTTVNLSADVISKDLDITKFLLNSKVYTIFGVTVLELLNIVRVQESKALLLIPQNSFVNVSSMVGFTDVNHFIKQFVKWIGMTPAEFVQKNSIKY